MDTKDFNLVLKKFFVHNIYNKAVPIMTWN